MIVDRVEFKKDDIVYNGDLKSAGVAGIRCVARVTALMIETCEEADKLLLRHERFSSVELYANGGCNLYVKSTSGMAYALVRIRPYPIAKPEANQRPHAKPNTK